MVQKVKTKEWYPHYNLYFTFQTRQSLAVKSRQCGNVRIFVLVRFYVKSILKNPKVPKLQFWPLLGSENCLFGKFKPSKSVKIGKNQTSEPLTLLIWQILNL